MSWLCIMLLRGLKGLKGLKWLKGENFVIELAGGSLTSVGLHTSMYAPLPRRAPAAHSQNFPPLSASGTGNEGQSAMNGHLYYPSPWRAPQV